MPGTGETRVKRTRGWPLVMATYGLLLGVSGVALLAPPLESREGRWGAGLALANLTLVVLGLGVTWFAYRRGERWAWWLVLLTGICYGLPMTWIDHRHAGWMGAASVLEFVILTLWATGLTLGYSSCIRGDRPRVGDSAAN